MITNHITVSSAISLRTGDVLGADLRDARGVPLLVKGSTLSADLVRKIRDRERDGKLSGPIVIAVVIEQIPVAA